MTRGGVSLLQIVGALAFLAPKPCLPWQRLRLFVDAVKGLEADFAIVVSQESCPGGFKAPFSGTPAPAAATAAAAAHDPRSASS